MIVTCSYEEIVALEHGGRAFLAHGGSEESSVAAPSAGRAAVESLLPRLTGDLSIRTMADQQELERGARLIVEHLRQEMDALVVTIHPAAEETVAAYFDFAHALAFLGRVEDAGSEMRALIEVMTGRSPTQRTIRTFHFPD
jgi:hypothetical protein